MKKRILLITAGLVLVIGGYFVWNATHKSAQSSNSNQPNIQPSTSGIYDNFLLKEATIEVRYQEMNMQLTYANDAVDCADQYEYDQLRKKNSTDLSITELERITVLHEDCGYKDALQAEASQERLSSDFSELSNTYSTLPESEIVTPAGIIVKQITSYWSTIVAARSLQNDIHRQQADNYGEMVNSLLQLKKGGDFDTARVTSLLENGQGLITDSQTLQQKIDELLSKISDELSPLNTILKQLPSD